MSIERHKLLEELISRSRPISEILNQLSKFGFDSEPVVLIGKSDVVSLLSAYLQGKLDEADIEEWAEAIEVRDDVGYRPEDGGAVKDVVFELANPLLSGPLTMEEAQRLKSSLQRD